MKKVTEKRSRGWFSKPIITNWYVTKDDKKFANEDDALRWEWYLDNKKTVFEKFQFSEFSPFYYGIRFSDSVLSYKFHIKKYNEDIQNELVPFLLCETYEATKKWLSYNTVLSEIKHRIGWFYLVLEQSDRGELKLYIEEYINKTNNE